MTARNREAGHFGHDALDCPAVGAVGHGVRLDDLSAINHAVFANLDKLARQHKAAFSGLMAALAV